LVSNYIFTPSNKQIEMKTFILSIYKKHELKQQKEVTVNSREELQFAKNGFWSESPYKKPLCWMGVKRVR
jgi:hypothetical protein